jgi:hypothetical protein
MRAKLSPPNRPGRQPARRPAADLSDRPSGPQLWPASL